MPIRPSLTGWGVFMRLPGAGVGIRRNASVAGARRRSPEPGHVALWKREFAMNVNYLRSLILGAQSVISSVTPLNVDVAIAAAPILSVASHVADRMEVSAAVDPRLVADGLFQCVGQIAPVRAGAGWSAHMARTAVRAAVMAVSFGIAAQYHGRHTALGGAAGDAADEQMARAEALARQATSASGLRQVA